MKIDLDKAKRDAIDFTTYVTTKWDDRLTGSQACLEAGDYIHDVIAQYTDKQFKQGFTTHPTAFLGFIKVCVLLFLLNAVGLWSGFIWLSFLSAIVSLIIFVCEFLLYWELLEPFYPKKESRNVYAFLEPEGEVKQQVLVTAHHDSAYVFNFLEKHAKYYNLIVNAGVGSILLTVFLSLAVGLSSLFGGGVSAFLLAVAKYTCLLLSIPILGLWKFKQDRGTPGAGDNMICTAVSMEIVKYFHELKMHGKGLKNTRVVFGSWDAEEAGLRGARAFVKEHKTLLEKVPSYNFNLECLYDHNELHVQTTDINSFVKLSDRMANDCIDVAADRGYQLDKRPFPLLAGGTDAGEFAKAGIDAVTLSAINFTDKGENPAYHTTRDTIDAVDPVAVERCIDIGIHYILKKDGDS